MLHNDHGVRKYFYIFMTYNLTVSAQSIYYPIHLNSRMCYMLIFYLFSLKTRCSRFLNCVTIVEIHKAETENKINMLFGYYWYYPCESQCRDFKQRKHSCLVIIGSLSVSRNIEKTNEVNTFVVTGTLSVGRSIETTNE